jgi:molybdopterin-guanine dinucleotide biosynthesis protein A
MDFSTIILAGGRSSRMGANKALVLFRGKPLIQYAIDLACSFSTDILISSNTGDLGDLGFPVVNDIFTVKAPLAGVHAGLKSSRSDWNLVLTCDMPNVTKGMVDRLLAALDDNLRVVIPHHNGFFEPLCGFYHRGLIPLIERNFLAGKLSMLDLPGSAPHRFISTADLPPEEISFQFRNVNEKNDLME